MAKSERHRQRKAERKNRKEREKSVRRREYGDFLQQIASFRNRSVQIKQFLVQRGLGQKFYDYLDSYADAFQREVTHAKQEYPTLLDVHELDEADYYTQDVQHVIARLGYTGLKQLFVRADDLDEEYLASDRRSNISGYTVAFRNEQDDLRTIIFIRRSTGGGSNVLVKYALKIVALLHEIGHVKDWEQGINFGANEDIRSIADAEVFAHEYALGALLEGDYRESLKMYLDALEKLSITSGLQKDIAIRLMESEVFRRCKDGVKLTWRDHIKNLRSLHHPQSTFEDGESDE
jgi:hypothetical protein